MARKKKEQLDAEATAAKADEPEVTVDEPGVIEDVDKSTPLKKPEPKKVPVQPAPVVPDEPPPVPKRYTVLRGGKIIHRRLPTFLKPGKVIDEREYNIQQVLDQGVALEPVKE